MKKILSFVLPLLCLLFISGCNIKDRLDNARTLEDELAIASANVSAYSDGYDDGYSDGYNVGIDEAYELYRADGQCNYSRGLIDAQTGAENYAMKKSGLSPDDALYILYAYEHQEPLFDGKVPTQEDRGEAIEALRQFCEYFYGGHLYSQQQRHNIQHKSKVTIDDFTAENDDLLSENVSDIPFETIGDMILKPPDTTGTDKEG